MGLNDLFVISADNLYLTWYINSFEISNNTDNICIIFYNETSCDFVYSVVAPIVNIRSFVYNCVDRTGHNVIGHFFANKTCEFRLTNEQIISNFTAQDNFVIGIDGDGTNVYGFADDFIFNYDLKFPYLLTVWPNALNISPRAIDISSNVEFGVVVGYCQQEVSVAIHCGFILSLNRSLISPYVTNVISLEPVLNFNWSDPRNVYYLEQSRAYSSRAILSVSIAWRTRWILIGIPLLNIVMLYSLDDTSKPISFRQNGYVTDGFGKSVAWLDDQGTKAVVLSNNYLYLSNQWVSSNIHIFDIQSDGFTDETQPIFTYPNSEQVQFKTTNNVFIRVLCSKSGHLSLLDIIGNAAALLSTPPGLYPSTKATFAVSVSAPCIRGTYRNYSGIELCIPCPSGTFSSQCHPCTSNDSFCPIGSVENLSYSALQSIEQDHQYPEAPENTVFDDLLIQNIFELNTKSGHCVRVSPITWTLVILLLGVIVIIFVFICEKKYPNSQEKVKQWKNRLKRLDIIGEGEYWIGGIVSTGIVVLVVSACVFSSSYLYRYPIENVTSDASFACDATLRNAKFSTTLQKMPNPRQSKKQNAMMFELLNNQIFNLKIDFIQTAFACHDEIIVSRFVNYAFLPLTISKCITTFNDSILSLTVPLPVQEIFLQLTLPGLKTIGAVRLGLFGSSSISDDQRFKLLELNFASTFIASSLDQVLAPLVRFVIELTPILNQTDPLYNDQSAIYSAIWSPSFVVKTDELFARQTRYTFFERPETNITISIEKTQFYINNVQQPIAKQSEIIFRTLLFVSLVLEVFSLMLLITKLFIVPLSRSIFRCVKNIQLFHRNSFSLKTA